MREAPPPLVSALSDRYRVERGLGEGGMATVYLAEDRKHGRHVALKILKPELAAAIGADRFLAEIRTTANLQHPNVLPLFDSGEAAGFVYYVMPYVDGPSLRDRLEEVGALQVDESVRIARELAEALAHAHGLGVVHRDVKPANILLRDGRPLIADFGIALALTEVDGSRLTETGVRLGTPYYMSPEQATGAPTVGPASDQYALGCVLYEMLTGEPPYTGRTAQAVLGKILLGHLTPATSLRASIPAHVDAVIRRALEPNPADRFPDLGAFVRALDDPSFRHAPTSAPVPGESGVRRGRVVGAVVAVAVLAFAAGALLPDGRGEPTVQEPIHLELPIGRGVENPGTDPTRVARGAPVRVSPDGRWVAYRAGTPGNLRFFVQDLRQASVSLEIPGSLLAFSPNGREIAYLVGAELRSRVLGESTERVLGDVRDGGRTVPPLYDLRWTDTDEILLTDREGILGIAAAGGSFRRVVDLSAQAGARVYPLIDDLPGPGRVLLGWREGGDPGASGVDVLHLESGRRQRVVDDAMDPQWHPGGYVLFMRAADLMAIRFDAETGTPVGDARVVLPGVAHSLQSYSQDDLTGRGMYALSDDGTLVAARGGFWPQPTTRVFRMTLEGDTTWLNLPALNWRTVRESRDGTRLLLSERAGWAHDFWIYDVARGDGRRLDDGLWGDNGAFWSPDGSAIWYARAGDLMAFPTSESEPSRRVVESAGIWLTDVSPSGTAVGFGDGGAIRTMREGEEPREFLPAPRGGANVFGALSPDERWMLYTAGSGNLGLTDPDVLVRPFPGPGEATLVSIGGGTQPAWSPDGRRIFYRKGSTLVYVDVTETDGTLRFGPAVEVVDRWEGFGFPDVAWDVSRNGDIVGITPREFPQDAGWLEGLDVVLGFDGVLHDRLGG